MSRVYTRWLSPKSALLFLILSLFVWPLGTFAQEPGTATEEVSGEEATTPPVSSREVSAVRTEIVFPVTEDTYVASGRPNENFGDTDALFLGRSLGTEGYGAVRTLLQFDDIVELIPEGATINSARLQLYLLQANPPSDPPMGTALWRAADPWNEDTVTWNTLPDRGERRAENSVGSSAGWYEWDVTDLVADWVEEPNTFPNYGVEIVGDESVALRERIFYSREARNERYPRLVVDYTIGSDDESPPEVTVEPLPAVVSDYTFDVSWEGDDPGDSGIDCYDVRYRLNAGPWVLWQSCTPETEAEFTAPTDGFYEFEARATDNAGNVEEWTGQAEASTIVDVEAPFLEPTLFLPLVFK